MRSPGAGVTCRCPAVIWKVGASNCTRVFCTSCACSACSCRFSSLSTRDIYFWGRDLWDHWLASNSLYNWVWLWAPSPPAVSQVLALQCAPLCSFMLWIHPRAQHTSTIPTELCSQALAIVFFFFESKVFKNSLHLITKISISASISISLLFFSWLLVKKFISWHS